MAAGANGPTPTEYIVHHLGHWNTSGKPQQNIVDFSIINLDTVFWSVVTALITAYLLRRTATSITAGVPGRFVGFFESICEFVHEQTRSIVKGNHNSIAPLALTVFIWIFLMNSMDFLPVDMWDRLFHWVFGAEKAAHMYHRPLPTADLNAPLAMAVVILFASIYYGIKVKGAGHFFHEIIAAPFGSKLFLVNPIMQLIEYGAKTLSMGMRLFGNMFAGELVFLLIALLGATATWWGFGLHFILGLGWAIFHIMIVLLQAFIFMMLTLIYLGQAHEAH